MDKLDQNKLELVEIARQLALCKSPKTCNVKKHSQRRSSAMMSCSATPKDFVLPDVTSSFRTDKSDASTSFCLYKDNFQPSFHSPKKLFISTTPRRNYGVRLSVKERQKELSEQLSDVKICRISQELEKEMTTLYYHSKMKHNNVPIPVIRHNPTPSYYLHDIDDEVSTYVSFHSRPITIYFSKLMKKRLKFLEERL